MDKHSPTSFEKEFNRLTFLASIATGDNEGTNSSINDITKPQALSFSNSNPTVSQHISQSPAQIVNYNGITTPQKPLSSVNGFGNSSSTKSTSGIDIDKINEILNSNAQAVNQSKQQLIYQNAMKQQSAKAVLRIPPQQSNFATTQSKSTVTQSILASQSSLQQPKVIIRPPTATVQTVAPPPLNPPLIISSSPQKAQLNAATNAGQTILLPANFAGMAGKVLIVSNPGKPSQAIAINPSGAQTVVSLQNQAAVSSKPVLLLPNNSSVGKFQQQQTQLPPNNSLRMIVPNNPGVQQIHQIPSITQQVPALTPVSLSTFQNIRPKAMTQPIRSIQPSPATVNKVFIAPPKNLNLQPPMQQIPTQIQHMSTTSQQIPISLQQISTSLPKVPATLQQIPTSQRIPTQIQQLPTTSQHLPTSFQQLQTSLLKMPNTMQQIPNQIQQVQTSTFTVAPTSLTVVKTTASNSVTIVSVKPASSTANSILLSNFDKTMSQHLLQLEKTDPHLFKGGRIHINQPSKPTKISTTPMNLQSKQDKIKMFLQQQQQQLQKNQQAEQKQPLLITTTQPTSTIPSNILSSLSSVAQPTSLGISSANSNVTRISQQFTTAHQQKQPTTTEIQQSQTLQELLRKQRQQQLGVKQAINLTTSTQSQKEIFSQILAAAANSGNFNAQQKQAAQQNLELYLLQQKLLQAQQQQLQQQQQNQLTKQMVKPRIETNVKKVMPQPIQPITQSPILPMSSSTNFSNNQPLKLLSSLTNMVNLIPNSLKITVASTTARQKTQVTQSLNIAQPGVTSANFGVQPLLFQLANANKTATLKGNAGTLKQQLTAAQVQEIQKNYLSAQLAALGSKTNQGQTLPAAVQMGSTSVTINTKIPIQTVPSTKFKSAFVPKAKTKTSIAAVNLQQAQINQLIQQGVLTPSASNAIPPLAKIQNTVTLSKSLHEQLKGLTPVQREIFIKQYSATAAGKQLQASLGSTANSALLASILKNRQALPTAILSPKGVVHSQAEQQTLKKGPKGPRGVKRNITEVIAPKAPDESPIEKRLKIAIADDQRKFLHQNYKRPFSTYQDAFNRLRAFHISYEPEEKKEHTEKFDLLFSGFASNAIEKKHQLLDKFNHLMLRESTIGWASADDVLMGRLYGSTERERFEQQKKFLAEGRAFVVQNKDTGRLESVALSIKEEMSGDSVESSKHHTVLQLSEVDNRLRIASKDIRNCETHTEDEDDEEEKEEEIEDDDDEATDEVQTEEEGAYGEEEDNLTEEIEVEEVENDDALVYEGQDNELAAATTNLLADMDEDDEYELDFS